MEKINFNKDKYVNLTNINWSEHVSNATIKFIVLTGKRKE